MTTCAASLEKMGELHALLTEDMLGYLKRTPPGKRRVGRLALARRLVDQSGWTLHDASPRLQKKLAKLHEEYITALLAEAVAGTATPGHLHEAGLLLRSTRTTSESIREVATGRASKAAAKLALVPHQGLPFTTAGKPTGHQ